MDENKTKPEKSTPKVISLECRSGFCRCPRQFIEVTLTRQATAPNRAASASSGTPSCLSQPRASIQPGCARNQGYDDLRRQIEHKLDAVAAASRRPAKAAGARRHRLHHGNGRYLVCVSPTCGRYVFILTSCLRIRGLCTVSVVLILVCHACHCERSPEAFYHHPGMEGSVEYAQGA